MENIEKKLAECGAFLKGHFVLTSREHSGKYIEKVNLYKADPRILNDLCSDIAREVGIRFSAFSGNKIEIVVSPSPIGVVIAHKVAEYLGEIYQDMVIPLFMEKGGDGRQIFKRGFAEIVGGKKILVVDDNMTTGKTLREIVNEVTFLGGNVIALAVFCDRSGAEFVDLYGLPLFSLVGIKMEKWPEGKCPLCKNKVPIDLLIGKGAEFLAEHPEYPRK
jgi:orotate phosphoribosyltransferase